MTKKKYYAVAVGRTPGIYLTWDDCKKQVSGFPCATYKSFSTITEAEAFLSASQNASGTHAVVGDNTANIVTADTTVASTVAPSELSTKEHAIAYVDGSFNNQTKSFSYGVVMFHNNEELHFARKVEDDSLVEMRNVAGEICGSMAAMEYALNHNCTELTIHHDYEGIAKWPLGLWKTNKPGTIHYKEFYDSIKDRLKVNFVKVKGHSNNKYNDLADELAKSAIF